MKGEFDLNNPPWACEEFGHNSDNWGDEQDRSEWFEAAAGYWAGRAAEAERKVAELEARLADEQHGRY